MSKEKQIEEMARDICECYDNGICYQDDKPCDLRCESMTDAQYLYEKGYRKQSAVEKLENKLFKEVFEGVLFSLVYLGADGKWHTKRNNAEKTTAIIERYLDLVTIAEGDKE